MKMKIAITGGIGSGKTTVLKLLSNLGYKVFSSDEIVCGLYQTNKVKRKLKKLFPDAVSGFFNLTIDRKKISQTVFYDKKKHLELTNLITPLVLEEIQRQTTDVEGLCFVEVPLLFECGYQEYFDDVWVVMRNLSDRIEAVKLRSNLTEEQINARINNQVDYLSLDLSKYTVINNDGDVHELTREIDKQLHALINKKAIN